MLTIMWWVWDFKGQKYFGSQTSISYCKANITGCQHYLKQIDGYCAILKLILMEIVANQNGELKSHFKCCTWNVANVIPFLYCVEKEWI